MTPAETLKAANIESHRLAALAKRYREASRTAAAKASAARRKALRDCSNDKNDVDPLFAEYRRYAVDADQYNLCAIQIEKIDLPAAVVAEQIAEIEERRERARELWDSGQAIRAAATEVALAAGLKDVTIDYSKHESQQVLDRSLAVTREVTRLEEELIGLRQKQQLLAAQAEQEINGHQ